MKKFLVVVIILALIIFFSLGFWSGLKWQQFQYMDKCLDMGGGIAPNTKGLCVKSIPK